MLRGVARQNPAAVAITGGTITGTTISGAAGSFTTLSASGLSTLADVLSTVTKSSLGAVSNYAIDQTLTFSPASASQARSS